MKKPLHCTTNDRRDFSCSDSQCYVTALGFKTMIPYTSRKQKFIFGGGQLCLLADIPFYNLCAYFIFNLSILSWVFQNTIAAVPMSRIWAKFFSIPCGETFYTSVFKIGRGNFIPHPIVHRKAKNIRYLT